MTPRSPSVSKRIVLAFDIHVQPTTAGNLQQGEFLFGVVIAAAIGLFVTQFDFPAGKIVLQDEIDDAAIGGKPKRAATSSGRTSTFFNASGG